LRPPWLDQPEFQDILSELSRSLRDPQKFPDRIPVQIGDRTQFLKVERITHFFAGDGLSFAAMEGKRYAVNWTIAELEQRLDPAKFVRIHRATLLNLDWLEEVTPFFTGRLAVRLKDETRTELVVARDRVSAFKERLNL